MARRIEHRTRSAADVDRVRDTLVDPAYLRERLAAIGGPGAELRSHQSGPDGVEYTMRHGVRAENLPGPVRTLLGGDLKIDRAETWRPDPAGGYRGTVAVTIPGMPGELGGTMRLTARADGGSETVLDGTVKIPIPLIGAKVEETVAGKIIELLETEHEFTEKWLETHKTSPKA
jgi:hypothetical protein